MQINFGTIFNPFAFICFFKETDASQKRRFAAAAGPKDDNYLAIFDIQIDTFEDMVFSKAFLYTLISIMPSHRFLLLSPSVILFYILLFVFPKV